MRNLVVTATNDEYSSGVVGMIKSFLFNSNLMTDHLVLAKDLSDKNRKMIESLPRTTVYDLRVHNAPDHWCTWILELFYQKDPADYQYVFYTDTDIMVRKELVTFIDEFSSYEGDDVCVIDHKRSWHTKWFHKDSHNFNGGFIVFKGSFFGSVTHQKLKDKIRKDQPRNDEQYLRNFFKSQPLLYAPTKFNARLIWLNEKAVKNDDIYVMHFVGQENKPWLKFGLGIYQSPQPTTRETPKVAKRTKWDNEWHKIFNRQA